MSKSKGNKLNRLASTYNTHYPRHWQPPQQSGKREQKRIKSLAELGDAMPAQSVMAQRPVKRVGWMRRLWHWFISN